MKCLLLIIFKNSLVLGEITAAGDCAGKMVLYVDGTWKICACSHGCQLHFVVIPPPPQRVQQSRHGKDHRRDMKNLGGAGESTTMLLGVCGRGTLLPRGIQATVNSLCASDSCECLFGQLSKGYVLKPKIGTGRQHKRQQSRKQT